MSDRWNVVASSVVGASHVRALLPCQDAYRWQALPGGFLLIAVADGAGSASHADVGAAIAVDAALARMVDLAYKTPDDRLVTDDSLAEVLRAARCAVATDAAFKDVELREMASTLIVAVVGPHWMGAAQVGDGAVVVANESGRLRAVTRPPESEYANETTFLISDNYLEAAQFARWRRSPAHLAVFTDGLQRLALTLPGGEPHAPFFDPLFRFAAAATDIDEATRQLATFLQSPRIVERADDDLTLLLASGRK